MFTINEDFLWYVWKQRIYHPDLKTTDGEQVIVEYPGQQNEDSGPDFSHARVRIGQALWAGNVEVHTRSSEWLRHGHQDDRAFDNVILHVVYENDISVTRPGGQIIPVVELREYIDMENWKNYRKLMKSARPIPCSASVAGIERLFIEQWLDRTLITRLERKMKYIDRLHALYKGSMEEVFYQMLASNFGFKVNAVPFELLARSLEYKMLVKHSNSLLQLEALLFGQAGLLDDIFNDEYPVRLQVEYIYLSKKLGLQPLEKKIWKFSRMHPLNFPTIRISQFAGLIYRKPQLLSSVLQAQSVAALKDFLTVYAGSYWTEHYHFGDRAEFREKPLGSFAMENIIINTIAPFLFYYGRYKGNQELCDRAIRWLENCAPENNNIIRIWKGWGIDALHAGHSQALIELKNEYCSKKNCLNCSIGVKLLRSSSL